MMDVVDMAIHKIQVKTGRRSVSKETVDGLIASIQEVGLLNAVGVTTDHNLIYGRHRIEACKELGWKTIPTIVYDLDDLHAEMAEIDENIQRKQLTAVEGCKALARRKEIYLMLHPETKRGMAGGKASGQSRRGEERTKVNSTFVQDTAAKTGRSVASVTQDVALGNALPDEIVDKIKDTPIADNKSELKKLSKLKPKMQAKVADMLSKGEVKSVTQAVTPKAAKKKAKPKPESNGFFCSEPTSFQVCIDKAKEIGRVPNDKFWEAIGGVTQRRWFGIFVAEMHYLRIEEYEDGTTELVISEKERDLCTAIHAQLERMRNRSNGWNGFKFDVALYKQTVQRCYDLVVKASTHQ